MASPVRVSAGVSRVTAQAASVERQIRIVILVLRDSRSPWYCKAVAAGAVGYNLSPVTLIPDWIPVIGLLDNVLVLGIGVWLVEKLAPQEVLRECRQRADASGGDPVSPGRRSARLAVIAVLALKVLLALLFSGLILALLRSTHVWGMLPGG
jgi:uncharacterized membrane protein YkvA (DUF1232 family)